MFENISYRERYNIIMVGAMVFSTNHFHHLANLFNALIKYGLKISTHKCQIIKEQLLDIGLACFKMKNRHTHP